MDIKGFSADQAAKRYICSWRWALMNTMISWSSHRAQTANDSLQLFSGLFLQKLKMNLFSK